jgi:NAD(P)-dependent dehydrogenase (short-subunit alcohol dehydrogenase family)
MRLAGKIAIVVGAGQSPGEGMGNGRATVLRFAEEGAKVLAVDNRLASAEESRPGRTVTVRARFADLRSVTRSVTLDAPVSATAILAEIAEGLVRDVLAHHPDEKSVSLLAISVFAARGASAAAARAPARARGREAPSPAPEEAWRVSWPTARSTASASASDGRRSATAPSSSASPARDAMPPKGRRSATLLAPLR